MRCPVPGRLALLSTLVFVGLTACPGPQTGQKPAPQSPGVAAAAYDYAIRNVSVIDVERGVAVPDQTVLVTGSRIAYVGPENGAPDAGSAAVIDGSGRFLMPGLIDSHVHYVHPQSYSPLFIAMGVALVRDLGGATETLLELRDQLNSGKQIGPEMITTGAIIDGDPPVWPLSEPVDTPDEARAKVTKLATAGVNQIKLYSLLKKDVYLAAVAEAHKRGLKAVGHVPQAVSIEEALAAGQDTVEHMTGFGAAIARLAGQTDVTGANWQQTLRMWQLLPEVDDSALARLYAKVAAAKTAICPTMVVFRGIGASGSPADDDPLARYAPAMMKGIWRAPVYTSLAADSARAVPQIQKVVAGLHRAGVTIIAGTDLANPHITAGYSLHHELELLQQAGIPAPDVLRMATATPAQFFGLDDRLGSIASGKTASVVLLRQNPLEDIRHASAIEAVILRGTHYDRAALDRLLEQAAVAASGQLPSDSAAQGDLSIAGKIIHRGRYRTTFSGSDSGHEDFVIAEVDGGYRLKALSQPKDGFRQPSIATLDFDRSFAPRQIDWRGLGSDKSRAVYRVEGSELVIDAVAGGSEKKRQQRQLPATWMLGTPYTASAWASLRGAALRVGQTQSFPTIAFGLPSWQIVEGSMTLQRTADTTYTRKDGSKTSARHYNYTLKGSTGVLTGETWTDQAGLVLKSVAKLPFGQVVTELE